MTKLSPAAEAIWKAYNDAVESVGVFEDHGDALAAALRALAEQVVPFERCPPPHQFDNFTDWDRIYLRWDQRSNIRDDIEAIARELEGRG